MLPLYPPEEGPHNRHFTLDGVLCPTGGGALHEVPEQNPPVHGLSAHYMRASRNFEGAAWASYDAAYRRQAANTQSWDWATIEPTIYNEAFTGRARLLPRCRYCLSETHDARDCQHAPPSGSAPRRSIHGVRRGDQAPRSVRTANLPESLSFATCSTLRTVTGAPSNGAGLPTYVDNVDGALIQPQSAEVADRVPSARPGLIRVVASQRTKSLPAVLRKQEGLRTHY